MALANSASTTIHVVLPQSDDSIAAINIFAPSGYSATLNQPPGTVIGQVDATALAHDGGLTLPLNGPVVTDDVSKHTADQCSPGANAAVWNLNLSVAGQSLVVPLYVNPTAGPSTALGAYNLKICLPPWDVPVGTPGRAFQGAQVLEAKFTVKGIFTTPASPTVARWEDLTTPYNPGVGTPNPAGTFESRAFVPLPAAISLSAKVKSHTTGAYTLSGKATEGGQPVSGLSLAVLRGATAKALKQVATAVTNAAGSFTSSGRTKRKKTAYFQVSGSVKERDYTSTGCQQPLTTLAPAGCVSATLSPWSAKSGISHIKP
jgi:hypothetical protein